METSTLKIGLAVSALALTATVVGTQFASGAQAGQETVFVPVAPCRLVDTRPDAQFNVGPRNTRIGSAAQVTFTAWGTDDDDSPCEIPNTATAISTNVTAVFPTGNTFITLFPADVTRPDASNLNVVPGDGAVPNAANVPLSASGQFSIYNNAGTVDVIVDINGYYQPSSNVGAAGPAGPAGPAGADGVDATGACLDTDSIRSQRWDLDPCAAGVVEDPNANAGVNGRDSVAVGDELFILDESRNQLVVSDLDLGSVRTVAAGTAPTAIATDGSNLFVVGASADESPVTILDPAGNVLSSTTLSESAESIVAGDGAMYVPTSEGVFVIDTTTFAVSTLFPGALSGTNFVAVAYSVFDDGGTPVQRLYALTRAPESNIHVINIDGPSPGEDDVIALSLDPGAADIITNGRYIFASQGESVWVIDPTEVPAGGTFAQITPILGDAQGLATDGRYVYVAVQNGAQGEIQVIDAESLRLISSARQELASSVVTGVHYDGTNLWVSTEEPTLTPQKVRPL